MYLKLYTDGSGTNSGPFGWAYMVTDAKELVEHHYDSGAEPDGTMNMAELTAVIRGLQWIAVNRPDAYVHVYTDSQYVCGGHKDGWIDKWQRGKWKNSRGRPVANKDLWLQLIELCDNINVRWYHVPGHSGIKYNEWCDRACGQARKEYIRICGSAETSGAQTATQ